MSLTNKHVNSGIFKNPTKAMPLFHIECQIQCQICFISHSYLINGTFPYGCITVVYNYILGQLILHNCVLTISVNSLYTLYSLNVDTMFYTVIQSTELVSYYTVDIGL